MKIRAASAADGTRLHEILTCAYEHYVERIGFHPPPMDADYTGAITEGRVFVAEAEGVVVGLVVVRAEDDHLLIENVAVWPGHQGSGVGGALLEHAERHAAALELPELRLFTHVAMSENQAFYARRGYRETGRHGNGRGIERVFFAKRVAVDRG